MLKTMKKTMMVASASFFTGLMMTSSAHAGGNNISSIASNIVTSIQDLPSLISALSYLFGLLLAVLGVMKIKDHVENPTQTPLSHGAIRLAAGGGLFALPIITESMLNLVGDGTAVSQASLNQVTF